MRDICNIYVSEMLPADFWKTGIPVPKTAGKLKIENGERKSEIGRITYMYD